MTAICQELTLHDVAGEFCAGDFSCVFFGTLTLRGEQPYQTLADLGSRARGFRVFGATQFYLTLCDVYARRRCFAPVLRTQVLAVGSSLIVWPRNAAHVSEHHRHILSMERPRIQTVGPHVELQDFACCDSITFQSSYLSHCNIGGADLASALAAAATAMVENSESPPDETSQTLAPASIPTNVRCLRLRRPS